MEWNRGWAEFVERERETERMEFLVLQRREEKREEKVFLVWLM